MPKLTHSFADFPFGLFIALGLAAIPLLLSLGQGQFAFGNAFAKVNPQGHEGQSLGIKFSFQFVDLFFTEEQLPRSQGSVVVWPSRKIFANVAIEEPDLATADHRV